MAIKSNRLVALTLEDKKPGKSRLELIRFILEEGIGLTH